MFFKKAQARNYSVVLNGRAGLTYKEGDRVANIFSEMLYGDFDYVVYLNRWNAWEPPFQGEHITPEIRDLVKKNITEDLAKTGWKIDWD